MENKKKIILGIILSALAIIILITYMILNGENADIIELTTESSKTENSLLEKNNQIENNQINEEARKEGEEIGDNSLSNENVDTKNDKNENTNTTENNKENEIVIYITGEVNNPRSL